MLQAIQLFYIFLLVLVAAAITLGSLCGSDGGMCYGNTSAATTGDFNNTFVVGADDEIPTSAPTPFDSSTDSDAPSVNTYLRPSSSATSSPTVTSSPSSFPSSMMTVAPSTSPSESSLITVDGCFRGTSDSVTQICQLGNSNCCNGTDACVWQDETPVTVCPSSCNGDSSCYLPETDREFTVFIERDSCIGKESCKHVGRKKDKGTVVGGNVRISSGSCKGLKACATVIGNIGPNSCIGHLVCRFVNGTILNNSCLGSYACDGASGETIGSYSCQGTRTCHNSIGYIGNGSCNKGYACHWARGVVGDCVTQCKGVVGNNNKNDCVFDDGCREECPANEGIFQPEDGSCKPLVPTSSPSPSATPPLISNPVRNEAGASATPPRNNDPLAVGPTTTTPNHPDNARACGTPAISTSNGHYYQAYQQRFISWTDAKAIAESLTHCGVRGHLATIQSAEEDNLVRRVAQSCPRTASSVITRDRAWIGLTDMLEEKKFQWVTGEPVTYLNWCTGEPNNFMPPQEGEDFVHFWIDAKGGCWNDVDDTSEALPIPGVDWFVVEFPCNSSAIPHAQSPEPTPAPLPDGADGAPTVAPILQDTACGTSVTGSNGHYYQAYHKRFISWTEAKVAAESQSFCGSKGHLATIQSAEEDKLVRTVAQSCPRTYSSVATRHRAWIGLTDMWEEGKYEWVTGEAVNYTNWCPGEPNNFTGPPEGEDFVLFWMDAKGSCWNDVDDTTNNLPRPGVDWYVVEFPCNNNDPSAPTIPSDPNGCFQGSAQEVTAACIHHNCCTGEEACSWPDETSVTVCPFSCNGDLACNLQVDGKHNFSIEIGQGSCIGTSSCSDIGIVQTQGAPPGAANTAIKSNAWRIRNAAASSSNAWALRGLKFCVDTSCNHVAMGAPFDSGNSREWGPPSALFDDEEDPEFTNFWKSFDGSSEGKAYVGLILDHPTSIKAVAIRPDNVVYGVSTIYIEYWNGGDEVDGDQHQLWEIYEVLVDVPKHYGDHHVNGYWIANLTDTESTIADSLKVGSSSCKGTRACTKRHVGDVGDNSCNGLYACSNTQISNVQSGKGSIGDHSCNGSMACHNAIGPIGNGSCNGEYHCLSGTGLIGDCVNQCKGEIGNIQCVEECNKGCPADEGIFNQEDGSCSPITPSLSGSTSIAKRRGGML